jgi:FMN phosphatase YigB (HAD superfamily)
MPPRTIVLDFDGTCTDVDAEGRDFLAAYKRDLAALLGADDVEAAWAQHEAEVRADPARHGMRIGGRLVAPPVDLYLFATTVGTLVAPDLDDAQTERLFKENYRHTTTAFRPFAREVVSALATCGAPLWVVTNSDPGRVAAKLDALAPEGRDAVRLHGDARKFLVTEPVRHAGSALFARVPERHAVSGWERPVFPRRGHYFDALAAIWEETGSSPAETLVIGDVFELDLVLPGLLGCRVHLASGPRTLDYERRGATDLGGTHADDLRAVLDLL